MIILFSNIVKIVTRKIFKSVNGGFSLQNILIENFSATCSFNFIQVGAWEGKGYDFLFDFVKAHKSAGIVIEPLPDYFDKLKKAYAYNPAIIAINKAVFTEKKEIELYRVDPAKTDGLPDWAGGIASIYPEHHKKANIPTSVIIKQKVQADTLMNIIKNYYTPEFVSLFQVDAEGYDYEVLKQIDFSFIKPDIIKFEYINLSETITRQAIRMLKKKMYYCFYDDIDVIAVKIGKIKL